jgi:two-component system sensor histidine kinase CpxA
MIRSLYTRILIWFWMSNLAITAGILAFTLLSGAQPLTRRWLAASLEFYAQTAIDAYQHGGAQALTAYLEHVQATVALNAALVGPNGDVLASRSLSQDGASVVEETRLTGKPQFHYGIKWIGATPVRTPRGEYILVAQLDPFQRFSHQVGTGGILLKAMAALFAACLLCWLLARSITAPLRTLQSAVRSLAAGDLSVRVAMKIPPRNDELTDLAREFDRMAEEIQSLRNEQQRLLGDISHELRSPLARLSISTELASRGDMESLVRMRKDIVALNDLIEQILTLTRLDMQRPAPARAIVSLDKMLLALIDDADYEAREDGKGVTLEALQPCSLWGEAGLLRSCLENVIRNAVRFAPPDTMVRVLLSRVQRGDKQVAVVTVQDSGRGVPEEALSRIFEPFYRIAVDQNDGQGNPGTGLGLSISKRIVTLYGGAISAHNAEQSGLVVVIEFPLDT